MKSVHLIIPDLFLPGDIAAEACAGLSLPALEKLLSRGRSVSSEPLSLEALLCDCFDVAHPGDAPVAAVSAAFDGLEQGCWLRADPVNLTLQRDRLLLAEVTVGGDEAQVLCASLNAHFAGQGMEFLAPHPQRWYLRLEELPDIRTTPLSLMVGADVRGSLPVGADAAHWHKVFNEIQMLLHAHPLNEAREARGEPTINSVWFCCGGCSQNTKPQKNFDSASSDEQLVEIFAAAADIPFSAWAKQWRAEQKDGRQLLVWTGLRSALLRGDLAAWRAALQDFEAGHARPIWQALRSGKIASLQIDIPDRASLRRTVLAPGDTRAFWRRAKPLAGYSVV